MCVDRKAEGRGDGLNGRVAGLVFSFWTILFSLNPAKPGSSDFNRIHRPTEISRFIVGNRQVYDPNESGGFFFHSQGDRPSLRSRPVADSSYILSGDFVPSERTRNSRALPHRRNCGSYKSVFEPYLASGDTNLTLSNQSEQSDVKTAVFLNQWGKPCGMNALEEVEVRFDRRSPRIGDSVDPLVRIGMWSDGMEAQSILGDIEGFPNREQRRKERRGTKLRRMLRRSTFRRMR
jgi:hypothetical protein